MTHKTPSRGKFLSRFGFMMLFPLTTWAHLLSITVSTPFPATVAANSLSTATFTVTNITSKVNVTAIDQSTFLPESGLSIASSTCGSVLTPGQSCTIQLSLKAPRAGQVVSGILRQWAKPSADGVQYPFTVRVSSGLPDITMVPAAINPQLPGFRQPVVAVNANKWLIVSGSLGNFHDFTHTFNSDLYVYDPVTTELYSVPISQTDLPVEVINQLASSDQAVLQDGDTLYIIGGFFNAGPVYTTLRTITAINVPGMMNAILAQQTELAQYVHHKDDIPQFQVTGSQLGKIGDFFYLAYGQHCEGFYCNGSQTYSNSVYKFITDPTLSVVKIVHTVTHGDLDNSGWRRRDYTLTPLMLGQKETLFAMGGPFTQGDDALVWTNGIVFDADIVSDDQFINQQANQYLAPYLSMFSTQSGLSHVATFSGLSNLYWSTDGLAFNGDTPYGNILDLISTDATGHVQEYANLQPVCSGQALSSCLYTGLTAIFLPAAAPYDTRYILQLDQLPQNTATLVGYIYAGMLSENQDIFGTNASYVTNTVYKVYVTPAGSGAVNWQTISNMYPGN